MKYLKRGIEIFFFTKIDEIFKHFKLKYFIVHLYLYYDASSLHIG